MATFLEIGLLNYFSIIFPALLVFVIVYAVFEKFKLLGENKSIHAIIAISLAFIVILYPDIVSIINFISPWFVFMFIAVILIIMVYKIMGATDASLENFIRTDRGVQWFIFALSAIIIIAGISHVYGQRLLPATLEEGDNVTVEGEVTSGATGEFKENVAAIFFHPKVLGVLFIFLVAVFAIGLLTRGPEF